MQLECCGTYRQFTYVLAMLCGRRALSAIPVSDREFLSVSGPDAKKLLQGLTTNDINKLVTGSCQASAFLNTKGRIVADSIIYQYEDPEDGVRLVVESDAAAVGALAKLLTLYKLRSKVKIQKADFKALALTGSDTPDYASKALVCAADPRLGGDRTRRLLLPADAPVAESEAIDAHGYRKLMYQYGIPCSSDILNKIPLECNMDYLNYVDFSKGCYLGQELTARTKYKGLVKKRLLPFCFALSNSNISAVADFSFLNDSLKQKFAESETSIALSLDGVAESEEKSSKPGTLHAEDGSSVGVVLGEPLLVPSLGLGFGVGMFRLAHVNTDGENSFRFQAYEPELGAKTMHCVPFRPAWMNDLMFEAIFKDQK